METENKTRKKHKFPHKNNKKQKGVSFVVFLTYFWQFNNSLTQSH